MAEIIRAKRLLEEQAVAADLAARNKEREIELLTYFQRLCAGR